MKYSWLPQMLAEIAEVAGLDAALALAAARGGTQVWIPRRVGPKHWLVEAVGLAAAQAICAHFCVTDADGHAVGRLRMLIPQGPTGVLAQARQRLARELATGNTGVRSAARKAGLSERAAWRMKAKLRGGQTSDQDDLFPPRASDQPPNSASGRSGKLRARR